VPADAVKLKGLFFRKSRKRPFSLFKNSTLADKIQFTFTSSLCTISSSFWWYTAGENINTHGGTSQQQQQDEVKLVMPYMYV